VTKAEVIVAIADKTGVDKASVSTTLESFFEIIILSNFCGNDYIPSLINVGYGKALILLKEYMVENNLQEILKRISNSKNM
jgi:5'-3' exonuclease